MRHILFSSTCIAASTILSSPAWAQDSAAERPSQLEEVVVVATRTPQPLDRIGNSVTVLDAKTIQSSQVANVADLLAKTPGITLYSNGGAGEPTFVSIRGADTDQTLVLIDGVKLNDSSQPAGAFDFGHLLIGDIDRIEVVRGSQSTLWGSDAMGGVVNVITAGPTGPFSADSQIEGGSRDTVYTRAGVGGKSELVDWRLAGGYYSTSGISAFDKKFGGHELDAYHNGGGSGRVLVKLLDNLSLDLRGYYIHARSDFDGFPPPLFQLADTPEYNVIDEYVDYTGINLDLFDGQLKNRLAFQYTETDRDNFNPILAVKTTFTGIGRNIRFEYQGTVDIAEGYQAVFGAQSERSTIRVASPSDFDPNPVPTTGHTNIDSAYGQLQATPLDGLTLTGGIREDHHRTFGNHTSGQVAAAWSLNDGATILRASFGQGFKAPSLYQLYSEFGNTALRPEKDDGWDAGVEQHVLDGAATLQATYFSRTTNDIINFMSCFGSSDPRCRTNTSGGFYDNIARAEAQGAELQATINPISDLSLTANYTYTESEDRSPGSATFGKDLPRRPRTAVNASATYLWPIGLSTTIAVRYSGHSFDNTSNKTRLDPYTLVDLRASYPLNDIFEVYGRIENLFNTHYETAFKYGQPGRGAFIGLRARI